MITLSNGTVVAVPTATVTKDPIDENNDNIEDAIVTIPSIAALGLNNTITSLKDLRAHQDDRHERQ